MASDIRQGIVIIKNVQTPPGDFTVEAMGGYVLADQDQVDMLDTEVTGHYGAWRDVERCILESPGTQLHDAILEGKIEIVQNSKPEQRGRPIE